MTVPTYSAFTHWYSNGHLAHYVRTMKSAADIIHLLGAARPVGDMSDPAVPDLVLYQDLRGGSRVSGDMGGGRFDVRSEKGSFSGSAPRFANTVIVDAAHELRGLSFPLAQWQAVLDEAAEGRFPVDYQKLCMGAFASPAIRSAFCNLSVTEIAQEVGYSSNQVLARMFLKHQRIRRTDYRRAVHDPERPKQTAAALQASEARQ